MTKQRNPNEPSNLKTTITLTFASVLKRREFVIPLSIILILTAFLYARALQNSILSWDDMLHITYNRDIQVLSFQNFKTIFTSFYSGMYQPFVTLSFALEYQLFGLNPIVHHATNVLFHLMNVTLVFFFVLHLTNHRTPALLAALLFGIHPMHVESVAWITERKDVVYAFFYFLALIYYVRFVNGHQRNHYRLTLLFFICSLLSKSAAMTLPPVLILIDYYFIPNVILKEKGDTFFKYRPFDDFSASMRYLLISSAPFSLLR